jgi:apolipoprotein N-acyltransferase
MSGLRAFGRFWLDFVVGDDWRVAVGVAVALAAAAALVSSNVNAWWLLPLAVPGLLWLSLRRAAKRLSR